MSKHTQSKEKITKFSKYIEPILFSKNWYLKKIWAFLEAILQLEIMLA
jgi:hypothetical protein